MINKKIKQPTKKIPNKIINAAIYCFNKYGYAKASVKNIANAAGLTKTAIFYYFKKKEDIYIYIYNYACSQIHGVKTDGVKDFFDYMLILMRKRIQLERINPGLYEFLRLHYSRNGGN